MLKFLVRFLSADGDRTLQRCGRGNTAGDWKIEETSNKRMRDEERGETETVSAKWSLFACRSCFSFCGH